MQDMGNPIVGDEKYGPVTNPIGRLGLHAYVLEFKHPTTGKVMNFLPGCSQKSYIFSCFFLNSLCY